MSDCKATYSVGDFADLSCQLPVNHDGLHLDIADAIEWRNICKHEMKSNYPDGRHSFCGKCYTSKENL